MLARARQRQRVGAERHVCELVRLAKELDQLCDEPLQCVDALLDWGHQRSGSDVGV